MRPDRAWALALTGVLVTLASSAGAFCRTTTKSVDPSFSPTPESPCWTAGLPLYWKNRCVGYSMQKDASRSIAFNAAADAMTTAFTRWSAVSCPTASGSGQVSIDIRYLGPVACGKVQYNQDVGNANVIVFRDDVWPHNDANNTLGLTTVTYNPQTGEMYDADMEINTAQQAISITDPVPQDGFDFSSIVTHEAGHFLGLAHSQDARATMYAHYKQGSSNMRYLAADDVSAICQVYPPDGTRASSSGSVAAAACDPTPRHGYSGDCAPLTSASKGCGVGPVNGDDDASAWSLLGLAPLFVVMVRRRSKRS